MNQSSVENTFSINWTPIFLFSAWLIVGLFIILSLRAFEVSEAREGVVVQEILNYNTWILPLRHGEIIPSKPPLFHWFSALLSKGFGLNDFTLRFPSLLSGFLIAFITYMFTRKHLGENIGILTLGFTLSSYCFIQMSTDGRVDMLFCALLHASLFYFLDIFADVTNEKPSKKNLIIVGTLLGFSILAKGPLGPVLFIIASFAVLAERFGAKILSFRFFKNWYLNIGLIPIILIPLPWYLAAYFMGSSGFVSRQLIFENFSRFVGSTGIPTKPFWFYFQHLFTQTPLSIIAILFLLIWNLRNRKEEYFLSSTEKHWFKIILVQTLSLLLFLSLSSGKRRAYLLPLVPHFAIIAGILANKFVGSGLVTKTKYLQIFVKLLFGVAVVINLLKVFLVFFAPFKNSFLIGLNDLPLISSFGTVGILLILLILICNSTNNTLFDPPKLSFNLVCVFLFIYLALPSQFFLTKGYSHSYYQFAEELRNFNVEKNKITFIKKIKDESFDTLFYYYGDRIYLLDLESVPSEQGLYLTKVKWLRAQTQDFQAKCNSLLMGGRKKDKDADQLVLFKFNPTLSIRE